MKVLWVLCLSFAFIRIHCADVCEFNDEVNCPTTCDFEVGLCGWTQDTDDDGFDWRFRNPSTTPPNGFAGPDQDHTSASITGSYLYVDGSYTNVSTNTRLFSPVFSRAARTCRIAVWHHFFGGEYGDLEIKLLAGGVRKHLYKVDDDGQALLKWYYSEVYLDPCVENFQVILEGQDRQREIMEGGIAIDDVSFIDCAFDTGVTSCDPGFMQCSSGACYSEDYRCDFATDCCGEDTDERTCSNYNMCDFESHFCDWTNLDDDSGYDWERHQGDTSSDRTGPDFDHTTGTTDGYYIYFDVSRPVIPGDYAAIASFVISGESVGCKMRYWYHHKGAFIGRLEVGTRESINGPFHRIASVREDESDPWYFNVVELSRESDFQVVFRAFRGLTAYGDIALDDISFTPECKAAGRNLPVHTTIRPPFTLPGGGCGNEQYTCANGQCVRKDAYCDFNYDCDDFSDEAECPAGCSFEIDYCYWKQDLSDGTSQWRTRESAADMDADFNGPSDDHSSGTTRGKYIYVASGDVPQQGQKTRLISPTFRIASRACRFTFWFYMFGAEYGDIEIFVKTEAGEKKIRKIVEDLYQYEQWLPEEADIDACTENFQIIVQAQDEQLIPAGSGFALDDFIFLDCGIPLPSLGGDCTVFQSQCGNGVCYPSSQQCDFAQDCCDGTDELPSHCSAYNMCDFETDLCDWTNLDGDDFDWQRDKGGTGSGNTGPGNDHTTRSSDGYYLYTEVDRPLRSGDKARIGSYTILSSVTEDCNMRFFYHLNGRGIGSLNVYTRESVGGPMTKVWTQETQRGDTWFYANVNLGIITNNVAFQAVIEGVRGVSQEGDMAIDDVSFTPGCKQSPYPLPTGTTPVYTGPTRGNAPPCDKGQIICPVEYTCISGSKRCNGEKDCSDGSDEEDCSDNGKNPNALAIALGVVFGVLGLVIIIGGIIFLQQRRTKSLPPPMTTGGVGLDNPTYNKSSEQMS